MKRILAVFALCFTLVFVMIGGAVSSFAADPIDPGRESSLTLQYKHGDDAFGGMEVKLYRVADVNPDGTYDLADSFKDYPVNIYGVTSQAEWQEITSTFEAFIAADGISPSLAGTTDGSGAIVFEGLIPGMYLTLSVRAETNKAVFLFESFITTVPGLSDNGEHNYDVTAYPKCQEYEIKPGEVEYRVVKQWRDNGYTHKRPEYIEVEIIKDGKIDSVQILSAENDWSYNWKAPDDGSVWHTVEKEVPDEYTVTVVKKGKTVIITNTYDSNEETPPQTGDITVFWPYVISTGISGGIMILIAVWRKRTE